MNLKITLVATLLQLIIILPSFAQDRDAVLGIWQSEHGSGRIKIYKNGNIYDGKLVWLKEANDGSGRPKLNVNNSSEKLRSQLINGLKVLKNFTYKDDGVWEDGTVYDPKSGKTYSCKLLMSSSDKLEIRAYMGISLIGKTQVWSRV